jgi:uncharacterized peroxidase-related enzyme
VARVRIAKPEKIDDPAIQGIFEWVTEMEGKVPNHFYVELNFPEFFTAKLGATKVLWEAGELLMEEIQHVGILVSQANGCSYCTAAFCTILNHGMGTSEDYIQSLLASGTKAAKGERLGAILDYALQVNSNPADVTDSQVDHLRDVDLTDKGIVQLTHVVSDFSSYNTLNLALQTDYDYRDLWQHLTDQQR